MSTALHLKAFTDYLVGKRVRVIGPGYYRGKCADQVGTVRAVWGTDSVAVELDLMVNERSKGGYFYFKVSELETLDTKSTKTADAAEKEEETMEKMSNYLNVAIVYFDNDATPGRTYEYANYTPDLEEGDLCVVMTAHHGLALARVHEIQEHASADLYREIVAKVDASEYMDRVERRKQAADLKAKMQERAKQLQDLVLYQTLAKEDPEMAKLLQAFMSVSNPSPKE